MAKKQQKEKSIEETLWDSAQACGIESDIPEICLRPLCGTPQRTDSRRQGSVY